MMNNDIEDRLRTVFLDVFGISRNEVMLDSSPDSIEKWDSLQHIVLVLAIEEEFGIKIRPEDAMDMLNFNLVLCIVQSLLGVEK